MISPLTGGVIYWYNKTRFLRRRDRGIAQPVEQRSPKPRAEGSSPSAPAKQDKSEHNRLSW